MNLLSIPDFHYICISLSQAQFIFICLPNVAYCLSFQQELREAESFQERIFVGNTSQRKEKSQKVKIKKSSYFSDEEELSDS